MIGAEEVRFRAAAARFRAADARFWPAAARFRPAATAREAVAGLDPVLQANEWRERDRALGGGLGFLMGLDRDGLRPCPRRVAAVLAAYRHYFRFFLIGNIGYARDTRIEAVSCVSAYRRRTGRGYFELCRIGAS